MQDDLEAENKQMADNASKKQSVKRTTKAVTVRRPANPPRGGSKKPRYADENIAA